MRVPGVARQQGEQRMGVNLAVGLARRGRLCGRLLGCLASGRHIAAEVVHVREAGERDHGELVDVATG